MADRVALMNGGRLEQVGSPEALYERPANRFVAGFMGHSSIIEGQVSAARVPGGGLDVAAPGAADGAAMLVLRPEKIGLASGRPRAARAACWNEPMPVTACASALHSRAAPRSRCGCPRARVHSGRRRARRSCCGSRPGIAG